jgi:NAD-reducing hydrogenase large subunit
LRFGQTAQAWVRILAEETVSEAIRSTTPEAMQAAQRTLETFKPEIESFANFPSFFLELVGENGHLEQYDGKIRIVDGG